MNRFEVLEEMFLKENKNYVVDGRAVWSFIEEECSELAEGEYTIKDKLCFDNKTYTEVRYEVEVTVNEDYKDIRLNNILF